MKQVIFSLPSNVLGEATEAILLGDFNNWDFEKAAILTVQDDGSLQTVVLLEPGKTYEYKFFLNDGRWINDAAAQSYIFKPEVNAENSVITIEEEMITVTKPKKAAKKKVAAKSEKPKTPAKKTVKKKL